MSAIKPDSRKPGQSYMIANLGNVHVETPAVKYAHELESILRGIIEIGKRDLSNPKYDSYFNDAKKLLAKIDAKG